MTTHNSDNRSSNSSRNSSSDNASMMDRASGLFQDGLDYVKNNPGKTAAVVGSVAAAAAAYMNKDRITETASGLKDRMGSDKSDNQADQNA